MKKYWRVAKSTWDEMFTYRLNFVMWRVRSVFQILTIYYLWLALIPQNGELFGYSQMFMLTYILGTALLSSVIFSSRTYEIGDNINNGDLSIFLIRPINYFVYWFWRDVGDKAMNIVFGLIELTLLTFLLRPPLFFQNDLSFIVLALISTALGLTLYFFISSLLGLIGFWSPETWAPRFIFFILITFFAGGLFPLDILPAPLYIFFQALPFTYLMYFPLKVYLGQISSPSIWIGMFIALFWIVVMYVALQAVWQRGLRIYTAQGR